VAKLADALGLGPSGAIRGGSSPFSRTNSNVSALSGQHALDFWAWNPQLNL
jgi:hypothetical protein